MWIYTNVRKRTNYIFFCFRFAVLCNPLFFRIDTSGDKTACRYGFYTVNSVYFRSIWIFILLNRGCFLYEWFIYSTSFGVFLYEQRYETLRWSERVTTRSTKFLWKVEFLRWLFSIYKLFSSRQMYGICWNID